jgi:hypothetical protein
MQLERVDAVLHSELLITPSSPPRATLADSARATTKRFRKRPSGRLSIHNIVNTLVIYDDVQDNFNEL